MDARKIIATAAIVIMASLMLHAGKGTPVNVQRFVIAISAVVGAVVLLSGCVSEDQPVAGVIAAPTRLAIGRPAPDFPVITAAGDETTFGQLREPIAIVAFVSPPGPQCCWLNPDLVSLAGGLHYRRVTVAQISQPSEDCPHGVGCIAVCRLENPHLISLCDANRIAWNAYRRPTPGTVVLVGDEGRVTAVAGMADLKSVARKAIHLADQVRAFEESACQN